MENGEICESGIPEDPENVGERGVTVIEDHTIVICGGMKTNGHGRILLISVTVFPRIVSAETILF